MSSETTLEVEHARGQWIFTPDAVWRGDLTCKSCDKAYGTYRPKQWDRGVCARCQAYLHSGSGGRPELEALYPPPALSK